MRFVVDSMHNERGHSRYNTHEPARKYRLQHVGFKFSKFFLHRKNFLLISGQTRNDLARSEIAFLAFLNRHSNDKENIPLDEFFSQMKYCDSDEDQDSVFEIEVLITPHTSSTSADCSDCYFFIFCLVNMGRKLSTSISIYIHMYA